MTFAPYHFFWGKAFVGMGGGVVCPNFAIFGSTFYTNPEWLLLAFYFSYYLWFVPRCLNPMTGYTDIIAPEGVTPTAIYEQWWIEFRFDVCIPFLNFDPCGYDEEDFLLWVIPWILIPYYIDLDRLHYPWEPHFTPKSYSRYLIAVTKNRHYGYEDNKILQDRYLGSFQYELSPLMILMDLWNTRASKYSPYFRSLKMPIWMNYDYRVGPHIQTMNRQLQTDFFNTFFVQSIMGNSEDEMSDEYAEAFMGLKENRGLYRATIFKGFVSRNLKTGQLLNFRTDYASKRRANPLIRDFLDKLLYDFDFSASGRGRKPRSHYPRPIRLNSKELISNDWKHLIEDCRQFLRGYKGLNIYDDVFDDLDFSSKEIKDSLKEMLKEKTLHETYLLQGLNEYTTPRDLSELAAERREEGLKNIKKLLEKKVKKKYTDKDIDNILEVLGKIQLKKRKKQDLHASIDLMLDAPFLVRHLYDEYSLEHDYLLSEYNDSDHPHDFLIRSEGSLRPVTFLFRDHVNKHQQVVFEKEYHARNKFFTPRRKILGASPVFDEEWGGDRQFPVTVYDDFYVDNDEDLDDFETLNIMTEELLETMEGPRTLQAKDNPSFHSRQSFSFLNRHTPFIYNNLIKYRDIEQIPSNSQQRSTVLLDSLFNLMDLSLVVKKNTLSEQEIPVDDFLGILKMRVTQPLDIVNEDIKQFLFKDDLSFSLASMLLQVVWSGPSLGYWFFPSRDIVNLLLKTNNSIRLISKYNLPIEGASLINSYQFSRIIHDYTLEKSSTHEMTRILEDLNGSTAVYYFLNVQKMQEQLNDYKLLKKKKTLEVVKEFQSMLHSKEEIEKEKIRAAKLFRERQSERKLIKELQLQHVAKSNKEFEKAQTTPGLGGREWQDVTGSEKDLKPYLPMDFLSHRVFLNKDLKSLRQKYRTIITQNIKIPSSLGQIMEIAEVNQVESAFLSKQQTLLKNFTFFLTEEDPNLIADFALVKPLVDNWDSSIKNRLVPSDEIYLPGDVSLYPLKHNYNFGRFYTPKNLTDIFSIAWENWIIVFNAIHRFSRRVRISWNSVSVYDARANLRAEEREYLKSLTEPKPKPKIFNTPTSGPGPGLIYNYPGMGYMSFWSHDIDEVNQTILELKQIKREPTVLKEFFKMLFIGPEEIPIMLKNIKEVKSPVNENTKVTDADRQEAVYMNVHDLIMGSISRSEISLNRRVRPKTRSLELRGLTKETTEEERKARIKKERDPNVKISVKRPKPVLLADEQVLLSPNDIHRKINNRQKDFLAFEELQQNYVASTIGQDPTFEKETVILSDFFLKMYFSEDIIYSPYKTEYFEIPLRERIFNFSRYWIAEDLSGTGLLPTIKLPMPSLLYEQGYLTYPIETLLEFCHREKRDWRIWSQEDWSGFLMNNWYFYMASSREDIFLQNSSLLQEKLSPHCLALPFEYSELALDNWFWYNQFYYKYDRVNHDSLYHFLSTLDSSIPHTARKAGMKVYRKEIRGEQLQFLPMLDNMFHALIRKEPEYFRKRKRRAQWKKLDLFLNYYETALAETVSLTDLDPDGYAKYTPFECEDIDDIYDNTEEENGEFYIRNSGVLQPWTQTRDTFSDLYDQSLLVGVYNVTQLMSSPLMEATQARSVYTPIDIYGLYCENSLGYTPYEWFDVYDIETETIKENAPFLHFEFKNGLYLRRSVGFHRPEVMAQTIHNEFSLIENIESILTGFSELESAIGLEYALTTYWSTYFGVVPGQILDGFVYSFYWTQNWLQILYQGSFIEAHLEQLTHSNFDNDLEDYYRFPDRLQPQQQRFLGLAGQDKHEKEFWTWTVLNLELRNRPKYFRTYFELQQKFDGFPGQVKQGEFLLSVPNEQQMIELGQKNYDDIMVKLKKINDNVENIAFLPANRPQTLLEKLIELDKQRDIADGLRSPDPDPVEQYYGNQKYITGQRARSAVRQFQKILIPLYFETNARDLGEVALLKTIDVTLLQSHLAKAMAFLKQSTEDVETHRQQFGLSNVRGEALEYLLNLAKEQVIRLEQQEMTQFLLRNGEYATKIERDLVYPKGYRVINPETGKIFPISNLNYVSLHQVGEEFLFRQMPKELSPVSPIEAYFRLRQAEVHRSGSYELTKEGMMYEQEVLSYQHYFGYTNETRFGLRMSDRLLDLLRSGKYRSYHPGDFAEDDM
jgi:hypothetical protein